jgi:hypothetical protein
MKFNVDKIISMCDQMVAISLIDVPLNGKVRIDAIMSFPWAEKAIFRSHAYFIADGNGIVDLSKQVPESGSYDYADSMGLISSLQCDNMKEFTSVGKNVNVDKSLFIELTAQCEHESTSVKLERLFLTKEVKRKRISDEFIGELFYTENSSNKTIVFLGGSGSGDLDLLSLYGAPLASHGFNVLVVAYFGLKGLPPKLSEVPLEYFDKVFSWLNNNPNTKGKEVNLLCISKGAELGLILTSKFSFITRVVAMAPHAFCFQGIDFKDVSSWTYEGKSLPYIRLKNRWIIGNAISCFFKNAPFGFTHTFKKGLRLAKNKNSARIKIEKAHADLLLITSKQCNMWNTYDGSLEIMKTLKACNYQHSYELVTYEDAGEPYAPAYLIPYGDAKIKIAPRFVFTPGGTAKGNALAQIDSWEKAIAFLKK